MPMLTLNKSGDFEVVPAEPEINSDDDRWDDVYLLSPPSLFHLSSPHKNRCLILIKKLPGRNHSRRRFIGRAGPGFRRRRRNRQQSTGTYPHHFKYHLSFTTHLFENNYFSILSYFLLDSRYCYIYDTKEETTTD